MNKVIALSRRAKAWGVDPNSVRGWLEKFSVEEGAYAQR